MTSLCLVILASLCTLAGLLGGLVALFTHGGTVALCLFLGGQCVAAFLMPDVS